MPSRRQYLRAGALLLAAGVAGCSADSDGTDEDRSPTRTDPPSPTDRSETTRDRLPTETRTETQTRTETSTPDQGQDDPQEEVDDWQYEPRQVDSGGGSSGAGSGGVTRTPTQTAMATGTPGGYATGGAKDVNNFRQNLREGYTPLPSDISYEGLFYDYYFDTGDPGDCSSLFCPTYSTGVAADPLSGETEHYLTVGLNGGVGDVQRKTLNLVVVLDISDSMSSGFGEYYYDRSGEKRPIEDHRSKIDVATEAVADLTRQLRAEDRLGIVVFNEYAQVAKPLRRVDRTDMDAIRAHLRELDARGGTRLSGGIERASELLAEYGDRPREYETRTVVVTDAMPNLGETSSTGLEALLERNASQGRYATFVGVGADFNTEVVDRITSVRGANYYSVQSPQQFDERVVHQFEYMVTPLVFDLSLEVDGQGLEIQRVYGTTDAEAATGRMLHANTLFPSPSKGGKTRGGVILAKVRPTGGRPKLVASWEDRTGTDGQTSTHLRLGNREGFDDTGVRKAVLLSRYADLLKSWAIDTRIRDGEPKGEGVRVPSEDGLGRWERQSTPLSVSPAYRRRFAAFAEHFREETKAIGDPKLRRELEVLRALADGDRPPDPALSRSGLLAR